MAKVLKRLLWLDMEMSGLDVEKEAILEVAAIATDIEFKELASFHAIIAQPRRFLDGMDDWNRKHHGASGLTEQVLTAGRPQAEVEAELIAFARLHAGDEITLAGNSIGQDRAFINRHMPAFANILHYRMLDVTAWKIMMNARFNVRYEKKNAHRAVDDIRESIAEMNAYLALVKTS